MNAEEGKVKILKLLGTLSVWNNEDGSGDKFMFANLVNSNEEDKELYKVFQYNQSTNEKEDGHSLIYVKDEKLYIEAPDGEMEIDLELLSDGKISFVGPEGIKMVLTKSHEEGIRE